jgi:hypothetical protein
MQPIVLRLQLVRRFLVARIGDDAVGGADVDALRRVVRADALGAAGSIDQVDRVADADRFVRLR